MATSFHDLNEINCYKEPLKRFGLKFKPAIAEEQRCLLSDAHHSSLWLNFFHFSGRLGVLTYPTKISKSHRGLTSFTHKKWR